MKILICSILRDNEPNMERFFGQINSFVDRLGTQHEFSISLYENDSVDATPQILRNADLSRFSRSSVVCARKNRPKFGSVVDEERIQNLAIARNNAMTAENMHMDVDYIMFIDSDVIYDADYVPTLLDWKTVGLTDPDIYSGVIVTERKPHEQHILPAYQVGDRVYRVYDTWCMRRDAFEEWGTWKPDALKQPVSRFYATYNGVCLFKAKPIKDGLRFHHHNKRLGKFDLEIAVLAEKFHEAGYHDIYINQFLWCYHQ